MLRFLQNRLWALVRRAIPALGRVRPRWCKPLPAAPLGRHDR